jgi:GH24 family phage-related lysozyme (muramidase)
MAYLDDSLAHLEVFEGIVPWMYLDTMGYVTVGVGEMLASAERAQALGFVDGNSQPISPDAILAEYNRVSALPPAKMAAFYRSPTSATLPHSAIDALLMQHLTFFDGQLNQQFASYSDFPNPAKLGLLDMIYNLGVTGLFKGYPTFMGYVQKQDWSNAALQCHRNGPNQARNDWTTQQFLAAAAAAASNG